MIKIFVHRSYDPMESMPKGSTSTGHIKLELANTRRKDYVHTSEWHVRLWSPYINRFSVVHFLNFTIHPVTCTNTLAVLEYGYCRLDAHQYACTLVC